MTDNVDICPAPDTAKLTRLAAALNEVEAQFRPPGLEQGAPKPPWDKRAFSPHLSGSLAITCSFGWLDLWFRPDGPGGYDDLIQPAATVEVGGIDVTLASLDDIIRSKEAGGRQKDLERLPLLRVLQHEIERNRAADR